MVSANQGRASDDSGSPAALKAQMVELTKLIPAAINDTIYRPVDPTDLGIQDLADDIRKNGLIDSILISQDNVVISGHRRRVACQIAGLTKVPVRVQNIRSDDDGFLKLLVSCNSHQREKSRDERAREVVTQANPEEAYQALLDHREAESVIDTTTIQLGSKTTRPRISSQKRGMADAVLKVVNANRKFWPLSVRQVHYRLLNEKFYRNAKLQTPYVNDDKCYSDASDMTTRLRLNGELPMEAISDDTRQCHTWDVFPSPGQFIKREVDGLLKGYRRNLQQSQPNHIEVLVEKNTVFGILRPIAGRFNIPITSARGFASIPPRAELASRFNRSGKSKLILIVVADFDPEGEEIPETVARSLRDDFGIDGDCIECVKAALTHAQVQEMDLPSEVEAKQGSSRYQKFVDKYGGQTFELESLEAAVMQDLLTEAIDSVIDQDAFNAELEEEKKDAGHLAFMRNRLVKNLPKTQ